MKTHAWFVIASLGLMVGCESKVVVVDPPKRTLPPAETPDTTSDTSPTDPAGAAATPSATATHGAPSDKYPAFAPELPMLVNNGGPVLARPVVITVTWPGEPNADKFESFGDVLGGSTYWKTITSEYGVGPTTSGPNYHVRVTEAARATMSESDLDTFVTQHLTTTGSSAWPSPTEGDPVYVLYLPKTMDLTVQGQSACRAGIGGYHTSVKVGGKTVPYAIVPQCRDLNEATTSASHEIGEAATDPDRDSPAWISFDAGHLGWMLFQQFQFENADACEFYRDSTYFEPELNFSVAAQWSNLAAKAGHNPCVPAAHGAYFNVSPLEMDDDVDVDLSSVSPQAGTVTTRGYKVKVGETRQVELGFYSDAPKPAWQIKVIEGGIFGTIGKTKGAFETSLDVNSGSNGQKAVLSITAKSATDLGFITVVSSDDAGTKRYMPIVIGTPKK